MFLHPLTWREIAATQFQQFTQLLIAERQDDLAIWCGVIPDREYFPLHILFWRFPRDDDSEPTDTVTQIGRGLVDFGES